VIENTVENDTNAVFVELIADVFERVIVAESAVDFLVICFVVAVLNRLENRTEVNRINVHFLEVVNPVENLVQTVNYFAAVVEFRRTAESEGIDVINNCVIVPIHKKTPI
jgi:hypothetical protein